MFKKVVTIFGTGRVKPEDAAYRLAYEIGKALARAGFTIVNGGYGGTMEASAKGAVEVGGKAVGVTCSAFGRSGPNEYINREIVADSLAERVNTLVELGAGYVVLPGGTGTLLELAQVWELKNKGFLNEGKPIIILGEFWRPLLELVAADDAEALNCIHQAGTPGEVVDLLTSVIGPE